MRIGKFVISPDFELMRVMLDVKNFNQYGENIKGVHQLIPRVLEFFKKHTIKATFYTVGFHFFETKQELLQNLPSHLPGYLYSNLSPYPGCLAKSGENYQEDPYHYAPGQIKLILQYSNQETGTPAYSYYYCLEEGQTIEEFINGRNNYREQVQKYFHVSHVRYAA